MNDKDPRTINPVAGELRRRDRRHKVWLLVLSALTLVLLIAAAVKENVLAPWRLTQLRYRTLLERKATDAWGKKVAARFEVEIKQIVVPALGVTDRCVSCHNGLQDPRMAPADVPRPHRAHPGPQLRWHAPARFGCTICHRGQGPALDFPAAVGHGHHWDYPLLPTELVQSSCGLCHSVDEVARRGGEVLARGRALYLAKGCPSCHKLGGRGGSLGPALDGEGSKVAGQLPMAKIQGPHTLPAWLAQHFDTPRRIVPGSQMRPPQLSAPENRALTTYMLSLQSRSVPAAYLTPARHLELYQQARPADLSGEEIYARYCSSCHDSGEYGPYDKFFGKFMPAVRGASFVKTASPAYVEAMIREGRAGSLMPAWGAQGGGLTGRDTVELRRFILGAAPASSPTSAPALQTSGDPVQGASLFAKHCSACHGATGGGGLGPSLTSPTFQRMAGPEFLFTSIVEGRRDTAMPAFLAAQGALGAHEVSSLVTHVKSLGKARSKEGRP